MSTLTIHGAAPRFPECFYPEGGGRSPLRDADGLHSWCFIAAFLILGGVGLFGCRSRATRPSADALSVRRPAPDFELTALDGSQVRLSALRGRPVLVAFWGFGCPPCRVEAPHLSALAEKYADQGLVVLGVNGWDEPRPVIAAWQEKNRFRHTLLLDGGEVAGAYGVETYPSCIWINREGIITDIQRGALSAEALASRTEKLLKSR